MTTEYREFYKPYLAYLLSLPMFHASIIPELGYEPFRENYKFYVIKELALEPLRGTRNYKPAKTTLGTALDIVKEEIKYGEKLIRNFVHEFEDRHIEFPDNRKMLLYKVMESCVGNTDSKYEELLQGAKLFDDIKTVRDYLEGRHPDGSKVKADERDMAAYNVDRIYREIESQIKAMKTYAELTPMQISEEYR